MICKYSNIKLLQWCVLPPHAFPHPAGKRHLREPDVHDRLLKRAIAAIGHGMNRSNLTRHKYPILQKV
jgi:hypothetical protein